MLAFMFAVAAAIASPSAVPDARLIAPGDKLVATGIGMSPCAGLNEMIGRDPKWSEDNYMSWAQGFMAGANAERSHNKQPTMIVNAKTPHEQWEFVISYCKENPSKPVAAAVMILYLQSPSQEHRD